jgi:hypothetical protein
MADVTVFLLSLSPFLASLFPISNSCFSTPKDDLTLVVRRYRLEATLDVR